MEQDSVKTIGLRMLAMLAFFAILILLGGLLGNYRDAVISAVTPTLEDAAGISPKTGFLIHATNDPAGQISLEPAQGFTLEHMGNGSYLLQPDELLVAGGSLIVRVGGRPYPFRVRSDLLITDFFPADAQTDVPLNAVISFDFNSVSVDLEEFANALYLRPKTEGHFEVSETRVTFIPSTPLHALTEYQIIVDVFADQNGAILAQPCSFTFTTTENDRRPVTPGETKFQSAWNSRTVTLLPNEPPLLQVSLSGYTKEDTVRVRLQAFNGWEAFELAVEEMGRSGTIQGTIANLPLLGEFELDPMDIAGPDITQKLLLFPEALPEGWYLATLEAGRAPDAQSVQVLMQVSSLSVFTVVLGKTCWYG